MRFLRFFFAFPFFFLSQSVAFAATGDAGSIGGGGLFNPLGSVNIWDLALKILNFLIQIGAVVIVFMVVYVGFMFVTARGNESKLTTARTALLWTIVGAVILLGAKAITLGICATAQSFATNSSISCPSL